MAQIRYHNYQRPVASLDENHRMLGPLFPGVKCGFDAITPQGGNTIRINHTLSGITKTEITGAVTNKMGCVVTRQGLFIFEDEPIDVNVDFNPSANWRVDLLIMQHSTIASVGGSLATYSVIKGANNAGGVLPPAFSYPAVSNPATQVPIGYIFVPTGAVTHAGTKFHRLKPTLAGNDTFLKNAQEVLSLDNTIPTFANFNYVQESGLYYVNTASNAPTTATTEWFVIVMKKGAMVVQFAQAKTSGKSYSRGSVDGVNWQPWSNLNNADITTSITDLSTSIGNRMYSENNYVVDGETITASIDKLDIEVKDLDDLITSLATTISNINTAIGNRSYTANNYIADGESITASLEKLDVALKAVDNKFTALDPSQVPWRDDVVWDENCQTYATQPFKFKIVNNILYFKGSVQFKTDAGAGSTAFTLPPGARPNIVGGCRFPLSPTTSIISTAPYYANLNAAGNVWIAEAGKAFPNNLSVREISFDGISLPMKQD